MPRELHGVVDTFIIGDFPQERMPEYMERGLDLLFRWQIRVGLLGDTPESDEGPRAAQPFPTPGREDRTRLLSTLFQRPFRRAASRPR
jgi:hypothetical protein